MQVMRWERKSVRATAKAIGRSPSSVSREMRKNFPPEHRVYTPRLAHERALEKRKRRGRTKRLKNDSTRSYVVSKLKLRWSPEQIAGRIKRDIGESVSHEAVYQFIYAPIIHGKPKPGYEDLRPCLRRRRKIRLPKGARRCQRIFKPKGVSIDERPLAVALRSRVGDWEGDSVESVDHKPGLNTLVERKTGVALITKLTAKTSEATALVVLRRLNEMPKKVRLTLTVDNGTENNDWQDIESKTGVKCFFAHPYHSWERPTNENTNGLVRDYFPKKTDFDLVTEEEIQ